MSFELTGKLLVKNDTIQHSESFRKREFVVEKTEEINGKTITNYVKFQCVQDRTAILDKVNIGQELKVYFNIKGTKWEKDGKISYFTNLDAWRIEPLLNTGNGGPNNEYLEPLDTFSGSGDNAVDDLPF